MNRKDVLIRTTLLILCIGSTAIFFTLKDTSGDIQIKSLKSTQPEVLNYNIEEYKFTIRGTDEPPKVHLGPLKWEQLPNKTQQDMMQSTELIRHLWYNDSTSSQRTWFKDELDNYLNHLEQGKCEGSYYESCEMILAVFNKYPVMNKLVLVVGSQSPWIEAIAIFKGAQVHTVDFEKPGDGIHHPFLKILSFDEVKHQYDVVISYSSLEHDGLGRYGDPIHPNGDILRMKALSTLIKPGGLMLLGVPIGPDALCFNAHRIYGPVRIKKMFEEFEQVDYFSASKFQMSVEEYIKIATLYSWENQPVFVVRKPFRP